MGSSIDMLKIDLVDQLEYMARQELGPEPAELAVGFLRALYADVPPSDLVPERPEALLERGVSLLEFIRKRSPGSAKVRVYEPARPAGIGHSTQTIIDIVNDDMPFLVDSVRAVLERTGAELRLLMHPILDIERDPAGELLGVQVAELPTPGAAESVMHISIGPLPPAEHAELEARIMSALDDVRATVTDFEAMRQVCSNQARAFRHSPLPDDESSSEIAEFLEWLSDRQFVFQGYAYVRFERAPMSMRPLPAGAHPADDAAGVRFDRDRGLGILRDPLRSMFDVFEPPRKRELLRVLKANRHSTVHRPVHLDAIIVSDLDSRGTQFGAHMFVGLFTSSAYAAPPGTIPVLHHKIERVIARTGFTPNSYNMRTLRYILETYPRNELFQISDTDLFSIALGIFHLQHRQRVALFVRRDPFGRFASCLVYVPRDRLELELKRRIEDILSRGLNGTIAAYYPQLGDEPLARLHFIVKTPHGTPEKLDFVALERRIENATRTWKDRLAITLPAELGRERGSALIERYADAFPAAYREDFDEVVAVSDIERIEQALDTSKLTLELYHTEASLPHELRFKVFSPNAYVAPSVVLPILENLGLRVVGEVPYEIEIPGARDTFWLHDFSLVTEDQVPVDLQDIHDSFYEVFSKTWEKRVDDDGFNKLVLHAGLTARQVALLRAYAKYLRQIQVPFSEGYMQQTLRKNAKVARGLIELFQARFDPDNFDAQSPGPVDENPAAAEIQSRILRELDSVSSLDEDRILRAFLAVILATTRTNFWQTDEGGLAKDHLAFKLDPSRLPDVPRPVPFREIFVSGPRVEGVHLRFGEVARGGLRWSDRLEDFRTEVLGLAKAQQVKNAVIVPVGSKGGFVVKRPPSADTGRDALRTEGIACYEIFVSSLLDLTDNRRVGAANGGPKGPSGVAAPSDVIVAPPRTVRHDAVDPYLVVAADKGTATFSDIANRISQRRGFWLDDAFASGGSAGYDHKAMGITAKGTWECVKRHFRELGKDIQREAFTCIGVGDMSGDVFGNGLLLSQHTRLLAAFDHRHIFLDPNPDTAASWRERQRLFQLDRSSWADYDKKLISPGGGVFARTQKRIPLSPEVRALLGVNGAELDPSELIRAILKAKVELAFFGGIGTYIKASSESDAQVGDRANDAQRINGSELGALVVGEGANLALTQRGRIEYSLSGGRCNADFIDNSAGVDCSDHEVNIKILLGDVERHGGLTRSERNDLLREMTDDIAALVLRDNYLQSQTLSVSTMLSQHLTDRLARTLRALEKTGRLSRRLDALPSDDELADRQRTGNGFVRPELCVLMAHSKNWLFEVLVSSDVPDSPLARPDLLEYFPRKLTERYERHILAHRLRREITATAITNELINRVGVAFVGEVSEATGSSPAAVAQAYMAAREITRARELWAEIEALDNRVPSATQGDLLLECSRLLERVATWLLHEHGERGAHEHVESYRAGLAELSLDLPSMLSADERTALLDKTTGWAHVGVPAALAERIASLRYLLPAVDIVRVAELGGVGLVEAGRLYFQGGARFGFEWLRRAMQGLPARRAWDRQALAGLRDELFATQRAFTLSILRETPSDRDPTTRLNAWRDARSGALLRWEQLLGELRATATLDLSMVTVASRQLAGVIGAPAPVLATQAAPPRSTKSLRPAS